MAGLKLLRFQGIDRSHPLLREIVPVNDHFRIIPEVDMRKLSWKARMGGKLQFFANAKRLAQFPGSGPPTGTGAFCNVDGRSVDKSAVQINRTKARS